LLCFWALLRKIECGPLLAALPLASQAMKMFGGSSGSDAPQAPPAIPPPPAQPPIQIVSIGNPAASQPPALSANNGAPPSLRILQVPQRQSNANINIHIRKERIQSSRKDRTRSIRRSQSVFHNDPLKGLLREVHHHHHHYSNRPLNDFQMTSSPINRAMMGGPRFINSNSTMMPFAANSMPDPGYSPMIIVQPMYSNPLPINAPMQMYTPLEYPVYR